MIDANLPGALHNQTLEVVGSQELGELRQVNLKGGPKKTSLFKNGFCSGSFIFLYFYVKLLGLLHIIEMKVHKKFHIKIWQNKASRTKTVFEKEVFFWTTL